MKRRSTFLLAFLMPFVMLSACGGGDDDDADDRLDVADPVVRLVHAVPGAPEVTLFRDNAAQSSQVTNLPYKGASRYFDVQSNSARWEVRTATSPELTVGDVEFNAERGRKYTLIAVPDANSLTDVVLIDDPYDKGVTSDNARLRVFNAAFNAADLDVYFTEPGVDIATATPSFASLDYKAAQPVSGDDSIETEGSTYRLRITTAGTKDVIFDATVELAENADWLIVPVPDQLAVNAIKVLVIRADSDEPAVELPAN
jgi:hypothetical protein